MTVNNFDPTEDQLAVVIPEAATLSAADQATLDAQDNVFDIAATQDGADTLITLTPVAALGGIVAPQSVLLRDTTATDINTDDTAVLLEYSA